MSADEVVIKRRKTAEPYECDADREYWLERKRTFVPVKRLMCVKRPVYCNSLKMDDLPWLWQIDKRETSIDISDWEKTETPQNQSGATMKRLKGNHAIDYCSTYGLSSWYLGHGHKTVTTVEPTLDIRRLAKANLKRLKTNFYEQKFIDIDCTKNTLMNIIKNIKWSIYDTIRLGSPAFNEMYDAIKKDISKCETLIVPTTNDYFIDKMNNDGFDYLTNPKGVDYFVRR